MASGTLVTRVFTGRAELPIAGASVSVVKKDGDRLPDLLTVRVSGRGGDTAAYSIETPEPEQSQSPGNPEPYALVDLWVDRQGFQLLVVEDVPIFPGVTSVQDLPLAPMPEDGGRGGESVEIPPQDL